jgi:hypothetical protein
VLAADGQQELASIEDLAGHSPEIGDGLVERRGRQVHLGQRADPARVDIGVDLFVPQLDLRRRQQQLARTMPGAEDVRRRAIERHRQDDRRRVLEPAGLRQHAAELIRIEPLVVDRRRHQGSW